MSTRYKPLISIRFEKIFDARLQRYGVYEQSNPTLQILHVTSQDLTAF
jgi:hypothetical protein